MDMQVKLLRVLESKEYVPLGSNKKIPFKARVIAATNENLSSSMKTEVFVLDLYYRLNVININIPAPQRAYRRSASSVQQSSVTESGYVSAVSSAYVSGGYGSS